MAANKNVRFGPVAVANAVGNLFNPGTLAGGVNPPAGTNQYWILRHIRLVNKTAGAVTFSYVDWYGALRLDVADFLTGVASAATSLTIEAEGEQGVA